MGLVGVVPFDDILARFDLEGRPLAELPEDSRAMMATVDIAKKMGL